MPDWDKDSPRLRRNLTGLLRRLRDTARQRREVGPDSIRLWHQESMRGLTLLFLLENFVENAVLKAWRFGSDRTPAVLRWMSPPLSKALHGR